MSLPLPPPRAGREEAEEQGGSGRAEQGGGASPLVVAFASSTAVTFDVLDEATIRAYVASGEPFGKAGEAGGEECG